MNSLSIGPVRRWRRFAGLFALMLVLTSIIPTHAATAGVVNGSFDTPTGCSLANWTGSGSWSAGEIALADRDRKSCAASISAMAGVAESSIEGRAGLAQSFLNTHSSTLTVSTIEQRFLVSATNNSLSFYVRPESDSPGTAYPAQTIALYNSAGQLITQQTRNMNAPNSDVRVYVYGYNLSAYAGQYVTLRLTVQIDTANFNSPTISRMRLDFDCPLVKGCGGNPGGTDPGIW